MIFINLLSKIETLISFKIESNSKHYKIQTFEGREVHVNKEKIVCIVENV
jgi:hypothetical protein